MLPTQHTDGLRSVPRPPANWKTATGVMLLVAVMTAVILPPGGAWADTTDSGGGSNERGLQVAAWAFTVPYIIAKGAFAVGGAVVGAVGYVFSGLNERTAKAVWTRSIYGTYIIRPAHLKGDEAVRFLGGEQEPQNSSMPASDQAPSQPVAP